MVRIIPEPDIPTLSTITSSRSPQIHVLSVDDNAIDRKFVERLLMASAFKVTTAESGFRALEILGISGEDDASVLANAYGVNLIITDYCMPGMTGYDLLKKVKETPALKDIPVVIISSENNADRIKRCLVEGAEEFLPKPLKLSDIKRFKSLTCQRKLKTVEQSGLPISVKRKTISDSLSTERAQKRPRLDIVAVS